MATFKSSAISQSMRLIDDYMDLKRAGFGGAVIGDPLPAQFPDLSEAGTQARAAKAGELLDKIDALDQHGIPDEIALALRIAQSDLVHRSKAGEHYWLAFDPADVGFYGMFAPTSYCGGFVLGAISSAAQQAPLDTVSQGDSLLMMMAQAAEMVDQFASRTAGQAERGIYMPLCQLDQAIPFLQSMKAAACSAFRSALERQTEWDSTRFRAELEHRLISLIEPAFDRWSAVLDDDYRANAPEAVGLSQYPGGGELYAHLAKTHLTMDLSPEEIHAAGHRRMSEVREQMAAIRDEIGFAGDDRAYLESLDNDPKWRADTPEGVAAVFQRYIDRIEPKMAEYFDFLPEKPAGAAPLPAALEQSMTFGFYKTPGKNDPKGLYLFNAANLTKNNLCNIGALNYHELVPGHHMHLSTQMNSTAFPTIHKSAFFGAFNEGWAEYAATLAGEMGMYEEPAERFGRLVMDAFLTCRLVVDTGMNAMGWSLEQAREYMRENAFMPENEIRTETIRYSCDIPGQSLCYKLGDTEMLRLRKRMQDRLGDRFDIRDFHRAVLHPGGMPLAVLEWHIDRTAERIAQAA